MNGKREILFEKDCLDVVEIFRKQKNGEWDLIARSVSSPYFDEEKSVAGSCLEYKVCIFTKVGSKKGESVFQVRL